MVRRFSSCVQCKAKFEYKQLKAGGKKRSFCFKCIPRSEQWRLEGREFNRLKVRIRDGFRCSKCNTKWVGGRHFDVHHLNGLCGKNSRGYDKDLDGLITVCHKCHFQLHTDEVLHRNKNGPKVKNFSRKFARGLVSQGKTYGEVAKQLGVSYTAIAKLYCK